MNINELLLRELIKVPLTARTRKGVIEELSDLLYKNGRIDNKNLFVKAVFEREKEFSTALENGVAIPHAKSSIVKRASIAIGISREGIQYGTENESISKIFFLIATPEDANNLHIKVLSEIASKLLEKSIVNALLQAKNAEEVFEIMSNEEIGASQSQNNRRFLIGVTGCPTGVAHTYLAANSLKKAAASAGIKIKIETNGSIGVEDAPTEEEIKKAEAIIVACDKKVDLDRFNGKKVIITGVKEAINKPEKLINKALSNDTPVYSGSKSNSRKISSPSDSTGIYKYLMNGVSYMIPFVVVGGLLIAISLALGGKPTPKGLQIPEGSVWNQINSVGVVGFTLMIPILAGFIAYAIGDRAALAPGMIGGWIANTGSFYHATVGTGFIGAIIAGFVVGYLVKWIKSWKFPKMIQPLVPIMETVINFVGKEGHLPF